MSMISLEELTEKVIEFREERGWKKFHTPKNLALSIVIELGELFEHFQWKDDDDILEYAKDNRTDLEEELADVAIYLLLLSHELGVDLGDAILRKLEIIKRKYPVGSVPGKKG